MINIQLPSVEHNSRAHQGGMDSQEIKKPLVNPATELITGDKRNAILGNAQSANISRAIHVWLRAMLTTNTCKYTSKLYDFAIITYRRNIIYNINTNCYMCMHVIQFFIHTYTTVIIRIRSQSKISCLETFYIPRNLQWNVHHNTVCLPYV